MNGIVDVSTFSDALGRVMKLAAKRSVVPELEQVKISFTGTACTLTATDLEQWGTIELTAQGEAFSFILGNAKEVLKMLSKQTGPLHVAMEPTEKLLRVKLVCGGRESSFFVSDTTDFPDVPPVEALQTYHADSGALLEKVNAVSYAAAEHSESRPAMSGVSFLSKEIYCVDGYRMAVAEQSQMDAEVPFSVPTRMFKSWRTLFPAGEITLEVGKRYLRVCASGTT
ncbi:MAG: DNA polymerase III subunit beta, partial [Oscillospiraceae bacterium]